MRRRLRLLVPLLALVSAVGIFVACVTKEHMVPGESLAQAPSTEPLKWSNATNATITTTLTLEPGLGQLVIRGSDQRLVAKIDVQRGTVEFGPGAPADEQARDAWRTLARAAALTTKERPCD